MNTLDPHSTSGAAVIVMLGLAKYYHIDMDATFAVAALMLLAPVVRWFTTRADAVLPVPAPKPAPAPAPAEAPKETK